MATKIKRVERKKGLAVASQVKSYVRKNGYFAGKDLPEAISEKIAALLDTGFLRARSNGRRTVRGSDI